VNKVFVFNVHRWRNLDDHRYRSMFTVDGDLNFPDTISKDGYYKTVYGPSFAHTGIIYARSNHNHAMALRRLTACRFVDGINVELQYMTNQNDYFRNNARDLISYYRRAFKPVRDAFMRASDGIEAFVQLPHRRRLARINALVELDRAGHTHNEELYCKKVIGNIKPFEFGKPGKYPRMVNDLGVPASLAGARLAEMMKDCMSKLDYHVRGVRASFIKQPDPNALAALFDEMRTSKDRIRAVYFSDDCSMTYMRDGVRYYTNIDISTCDTSHYDESFHAVRRGLSGTSRDVFNAHLKFMRKNITLKEFRGRLRAKLYSKRPFMLSGLTKTTLFNNNGTLAIIDSIGRLDVINSENITAAARAAGYVVTVQESCDFESLQFLKHSPIIHNGTTYAVINLGVIMRTLGRASGDLPGRNTIPLYERAVKHLSCVVNGIAQGAMPDFVDQLSRKFPVRTSIDVELPWVVQQTQHIHRERVVIPLEAFAKRYHLLGHEISAFRDMMREADVFTSIRSTLVDKVLQLDYGMDALTW